VVVSKLYTAGELYTVGELCGRGQAVWLWASCVAVGELCGRGRAVWPVGKLCGRGQAVWSWVSCIPLVSCTPLASCNIAGELCGSGELCGGGQAMRRWGVGCSLASDGAGGSLVPMTEFVHSALSHNLYRTNGNSFPPFPLQGCCCHFDLAVANSV
jgi:hypothetical protein